MNKTERQLLVGIVIVGFGAAIVSFGVIIMPNEEGLRHFELENCSWNFKKDIVSENDSNKTMVIAHEDGNQTLYLTPIQYDVLTKPDTFTGLVC